MSRQYAVFHSEKGSVSSGGIGNHIDRVPGAEHSYRHSDPEKKYLNRNIIVNEHCRKPLHVAISDRITEGYNNRNKAGELKEIRKDAVKYQTHILTGSAERMKEIESDPQKRKKWIDENLEFIKKEFGEQNIVRFTVHRDEKTMHIHAVTVPLTIDGRLSAKEIMGNRKSMQERQDRYAESMSPFGLERGEKSTGIKHENAREYYGRMEKALESGNKEFEATANKTFLGVNFGADKGKVINLLKVEISAQKTALSAFKNNFSIQQKKVAEITRRKNVADEEVKKKEKELQETKVKASEVIHSIAFSERFRTEFIDSEKKKALSKIYLEIQNSRERVSTEKIDSLIRGEMKKLNPIENPWRTFDEHFGKTEEKKLWNHVENKNLEIETKRQNQKLSEKQENPVEKNRGFGVNR